LKALQNLRGTSPDVRLMLAELLHRPPRLVAGPRGTRPGYPHESAHGARMGVAGPCGFRERKRELAEDHVRVLLTLDPDNYTGNLMLGSFQYGRGQYALAESSYRAALNARRDPAVLNDLAYLLMIKEGPLDEARELIEDALLMQPDNTVFLSTRGELNLREGRLDEAEADLQRVLAALPDHAQASLLAAQLYAARGQKDAALELAESLADRQGELAPEQQLRLQELLRQLR
jgi:predicted Zn-dependent protease